ncbi:MAG: hypothetical protein Q9208_003310 [Pyrenodesmia sp. 3 TL-2023]
MSSEPHKDPTTGSSVDMPSSTGAAMPYAVDVSDYADGGLDAEGEFSDGEQISEGGAMFEDGEASEEEEISEEQEVSEDEEPSESEESSDSEKSSDDEESPKGKDLFKGHKLSYSERISKCKELPEYEEEDEDKYGKRIIQVYRSSTFNYQFHTPVQWCNTDVLQFCIKHTNANNKEWRRLWPTLRAFNSNTSRSIVRRRAEEAVVRSAHFEYRFHDLRKKGRSRPVLAVREQQRLEDDKEITRFYSNRRAFYSDALGQMPYPPFSRLKIYPESAIWLEQMRNVAKKL